MGTKETTRALSDDAIRIMQKYGREYRAICVIFENADMPFGDAHKLLSILIGMSDSLASDASGEVLTTARPPEYYEPFVDYMIIGAIMNVIDREHNKAER